MSNKSKAKHPLTGKFFHIWKNKIISQQGQVLEVIDRRDRELVKVERYSWKDGLASGTVLVELSSLMDGKATWYDNAEQMRSAYEDWAEKHPILPRRTA